MTTNNSLYLGDCLEVLRNMPDDCIDAVVTDPPYGLSFMGKKWDYDVPSTEIWAECLRVLKPGGHLLAFAGTRTQHRMAVRIEDAGFEIRDMIAWVYGSGFPKSLDVSKALDKAAGAEREKVLVPSKSGNVATRGQGPIDMQSGFTDISEPVTDAARQWSGWGTALKPALETVTFASKPYTHEQEQDIIQSNLIRLEARLWLLSSASAAEKNSTSNQNEYGAACAIAQWSADEITNTRAALCDLMGTSLFELATNTSLNIVSSWRRTLAESWNDGSTSTTETKSSTTIDWKTLKFSLSRITPESIIKACSLPGGFSANASTAESHFNASLSLLQSIHTLSATEPAISQAAESYLGAGVKPNLDPCIMARKPLVGTVASNVLEWGTGALNVDGCRVHADDAPAGRKRHGGGIAENHTSFVLPDSDHESPAGRWPANLIHDGSDEVVGLFPQAGGGYGKRGGRAGATVGDYGMGATMETVGYGDTGSAARFFKECPPDTDYLTRKGCYNNPFSKEEGSWQDQSHSQLNAGTAVLSLSLQSASESIVQSVAATLPSLAGIVSNDSTGRSTNVTQDELKTIAAACTTAMMTIGSGFSQESRLEKHTQNGSLVSVAATKGQTGTTTITVSLSKSDGFAESATFSITPTNLDRGEVASRFRYCAKASKKDRGDGNTHPTVKPTDLMRYLCRLITPPGGVVLDPFMGSGSTGKAAVAEGFRFIGIEKDEHSFETAKQRVV